MGEAKRRANRNERVITNLIGEKYRLRRTSSTPSEIIDYWNEAGTALLSGLKIPDAKVPCNGCRECCWHARVDLHPAMEDLSGLVTVLDEGGLRLAKNEDGSCVHLGPNGCTVHDRRPLACRMYDCRVNTLVGLVEPFDNGHEAPAWELAVKSDNDKVILIAGRMASVPNLLKKLNDPTAEAQSIKGALLAMVKYLPVAHNFYARLKSLPKATREKIMADAVDITRETFSNHFDALKED